MSALRDDLLARTGTLVTGENVLEPLLRDGMTVGIGGFGLDRKPMALVRAIAQSKVENLTIETYAGGFDIEVLVGAGKLACLSTCHVGLDHFGLAPLFRAARESGRVAFKEWSELSQLAAWRAAAEGVPFTTIVMDMRSDLLRVNPDLKSVESPFDGRPAVAVKAPAIDLAILHADAAHPQGWALTAGDPYLDTILARAAETVVLSAERIMDDGELEERHREVHLLGSYVDAVVVAPQGALPGSCLPQYMIDLPTIRRYVEESAAGAPQADLVRMVLGGLPPFPIGS
jgi:glutaconate CoA-transferase subunit A